MSSINFSPCHVKHFHTFHTKNGNSCKRLNISETESSPKLKQLSRKFRSLPATPLPRIATFPARVLNFSFLSSLCWFPPQWASDNLSAVLSYHHLLFHTFFLHCLLFQSSSLCYRNVKHSTPLPLTSCVRLALLLAHFIRKLSEVK